MVVVCCLVADLVASSWGTDIEEVVRYRDGYCLPSGEPININGLTRLPKLLCEIKTSRDTGYFDISACHHHQQRLG